MAPKDPALAFKNDNEGKLLFGSKQLVEVLYRSLLFVNDELLSSEAGEIELPGGDRTLVSSLSSGEFSSKLTDSNIVAKKRILYQNDVKAKG